MSEQAADDRYVFAGGENRWHVICRLAEEVGWTIKASEQDALRLRVADPVPPQARKDATRAEFLRRLCDQAGAPTVEFYALKRVA